MWRLSCRKYQYSLAEQVFRLKAGASAAEKFLRMKNDIVLRKASSKIFHFTGNSKFGTAMSFSQMEFLAYENRPKRCVV